MPKTIRSSKLWKLLPTDKKRYISKLLKSYSLDVDDFVTIGNFYFSEIQNAGFEFKPGYQLFLIHLDDEICKGKAIHEFVFTILIILSMKARKDYNENQGKSKGKACIYIGCGDYKTVSVSFYVRENFKDDVIVVIDNDPEIYGDSIAIFLFAMSPYMYRIDTSTAKFYALDIDAEAYLREAHKLTY